VIYTDLGMMASVTTVCEDCEGRRFQSSVLNYRLGGLNIAEVLDLPVDDAVIYFGEGEARTPAALTLVKRLAAEGRTFADLSDEDFAAAHPAWFAAGGVGVVAATHPRGFRPGAARPGG
jgi:hypothetical protein